MNLTWASATSMGFVSMFVLGSALWVLTEGGPRRVVRAGVDSLRWTVFRLANAEDWWAYHEQGPMTYAQMRDLRGRGWVAATVEDVVVARMHHEARHSGEISRHWAPKIRHVLLAMSPPSVAAFTDANCDLWVSHPVLAQEWFDAVGPLAPLAVNAGLPLDEAVALHTRGGLDGASLLALAALQAPARTAPLTPPEVW